MSIALVAARLAIIVVFTTSGIAKLADLDGTRRAMKGFGLGDSVAGGVCWLLPLVELLVAALMLGSTTAWWGSVGALALLALFSVAIAVNLSRGRHPECHCFGQLASEPISAATLGRNAALAVPPLVVIVAGRTDAGPSALAWLIDLRAGEQVLLAVCVVLTVAVIGLLIAHRRMAVSIRVLEILFDEHLERRPTTKQGVEAPSPTGLPVGAPVPEVTLLTLQGESVSTANLLEGRGPAALIFVSSGCSACTEVLEGLDNDLRDAGDRPRVILIARGSPATNAQLVSKHSGVRLLFDRETAAAVAFRATWTPAAVLVSPEGTIASDTRFGKAAIEDLLTGASAASDIPSGDSKLGEPVPALQDVLSGTKTALLYWSPSCGYCREIEQDLTRWASAPPVRAPRLVLLTAQTVPLANRFDAAAVITDTDGAIARSFGLVGTPAAVLTSADGRIASAVGVGADDVKALLGCQAQ